jgi:hypothetical protein
MMHRLSSDLHIKIEYIKTEKIPCIYNLGPNLIRMNKIHQYSVLFIALFQYI